MNSSVVSGFRLSPQQRRLWLLSSEGSPYRAQVLIQLAGELDRRAVEAALVRVMDRHEILRTSFRHLPAIRMPVQVVAERGVPHLRELDLAGLAPAGREERLAEVRAEELARPLDLQADSAARFVLLRESSAWHFLLCTLPALCADTATLHNFFAEVAGSLGGQARSLSLPEEDGLAQYVHFSEWQNEISEDEEEIGGEHWRTLVPLITASAPLAGERAPLPQEAFALVGGQARVAEEVSERLSQMCAELSLSPAVVLLGCWAVLLSRWSGTSELPIHSVFDGRKFSELQTGMGLFAKAIPIVVHVPAELGLVEVARALGEEVARAETWQEHYFWQDRPASEAAGESVGFEYRRWPEPRRTRGVELSLLAEEVCFEPFKVRLVCSETPEGLLCEVQADRRRLGAAECAALVSQYAALLASASLAPLAAVGELAAMGEEERRRLVVEWNGPRRSLSGLSVPEQFERQVALGAGRPALRFEEEVWSYGELNARANRLAHRLRRLGVAPERPVALCLERSPALVAALLGVLKAGGAYLPLEPTLPRERRQLMLCESGASLVVSQRSVVGGGEGWEGVPLLCLDEESAALSAEGAENPSVGPLPENLAYVLFTSGSTGTPKGVAVEHRQLSGYVDAIRERLALPDGAVYGLVSTFAADLGNTVLFPSLCSGGELLVVSQERLGDGEALGEYLSRHPVDCLKIVPSHLRALLQSSRASSIVPRRCLVLGGESWRGDLLSRVRELSPGCRVLNHYGPTETTVGVLSQEVEGELGGEESPALGRPLAHAEIHLLDGDLRPVPSGPAGEIYVGGSALARGYLGRPELTAERFVPHPWSGERGGERLYRTGDLARFTPSGDLLFLGRGDRQVKIRGFRVELGEIEAALRAEAGVRDAAVVALTAQPDSTGDPLLVAYVVPQAAEPAGAEPPLSGAQLRQALGRVLPAPLLPAAFVLLSALPLTSNGKLDLQALPRPLPDAGRGPEGFTPPRTATEELLAKVWEQVLGRERIGIHDEFFELGGHSLLATQVISRVRHLWNIELPLRDLFQAPTVARLASRIERAREERSGVAAPPIVRLESGESLLSFAQQRLWVVHQLEPESPAYNLPMALRLSGPLAVPVFDAVLGEVVRRHEILRSTFPSRAGRPVQVAAPAAGWRCPVVDLCWLAVPVREALVRSLGRAEALRTFDLGRGPLLRTILVRVAPDEHVVLLTMHHIVSDGWSRHLLAREVGALYEALVAGRPSPLPEPAIQYADFARWQQEWLQGEVLEAQLAYWRRQLAGSPPVLELPADRPRPRLLSGRGVDRQVTLAAGLAEALAALGRREGTTLFMSLLAAFYCVLHHYTGRDDLAVGTDVASRNQAATEGLLGFFVNQLVLRADLAGDPTFRDLLARVRRLALDAYTHQDLPFERLVEELQPERDLSRHPLFQVAFVLQNVPAASLTLPGLTISPLAEAHETAKFDLSLAVGEVPGGLQVGAEASADLFEPATVERLLAHFATLLRVAVAAPDLRLSELPLLGGAERQQVLSEWNDSAARFPAGESCFQQLFEARVAAAPTATAATLGGERLSFDELNRRANRLARSLVAEGVAAESLVPLVADRSLDFLTAVLAVFKAGGAYLPLDPQSPPRRLAALVGDSASRLVLVEERYAAGLREALAGSGSGDRHRLFVLEEMLSREQGEADLPLRSEPGNLAYVIYTSGSTGQPKGAMVEQRGMVNHLLAKVGELALTEKDVVAQTASQCFDISVWQFLSPLAAGGRVHIVPDPIAQDPLRLVEEVRQGGITVLETVPSLLQLMLGELADGAAAELAGLRWLIATGEALSPDLADRWLTLYPEVPLLNAYGPTECSDDVTHHRMAAVSGLGDRPSPIGLPIANLRLYGMTRDLQPLPVGVPGELFVAGTGVGRGYLHDGGRTAEAWLPAPPSLSEPAGTRLYRTGDLGRRRADGRIEFLGRIDQQVKVHGHRIELGEIEVVLGRHRAVRESAVLARELSAGHQRLVAYLVLAEAGGSEGGGADALLTELRAYVAERLPEWMVPAAFVLLDRFPLTPNGKLDRRALPDAAAPLAASSADSAPLGPVEEILARIWSEVLGLETVGRNDNFFELGGDSILGIQIVARARQQGVGLAPRDLFRNQTIADLAKVAEFGEAAMSPDLRDLVTGPVPLTPIQRWFFAESFSQPHHFNQTFLLQPNERLGRALLAEVLRRLLDHHDALRMRFFEEGGQWRQVCAEPGAAVPLVTIDLSELHDEAQAAALSESCAAVQTGFDLGSGPLLRAALFDFGDGAAERLLITIHHLVVDGLSWRILLEDLEAAYRQLADGGAVELPAKTTSFKEWSKRLNDHAAAGGFDDEWPYWLSQGDAAIPPLPVDWSAGANTVASASTLSGSLNAVETTALLQQVPKIHGSQIDEVLLTAVARALHRWQGGGPVVINLESHGREHFEELDVSRTVGWFTSDRPLVLEVADELSPADALRSVREQLGTLPPTRLGYGALRFLTGEGERQESLGRLAAAGVVFNYLGQLDRVLPEASLLRPAPESPGPARSRRARRSHLLEINADVSGGRLNLVCKYSKNVHRAGTISKLSRSILEELRSLIHDPGGEGVGVPPGRERGRAAAPESVRAAAAPGPASYPLSPIQKGLLFHFLSGGDSSLYLSQSIYELRGDIIPGALKRALASVIERHAVLRTSFDWESGAEPVQVVHAAIALPWEEEDWRAPGMTDPQPSRLEGFLAADRKRGLDLSRPPLLRVTFIRLAEDHCLLVWSHHHLLLDGWSMPLVAKEFTAFYKAFRQGRELRLPAPRPFSEYIAWIGRQDLAQAEAFWRKTFAGYAAPSTLFPGPIEAAPSMPSAPERLIGLGPEVTSALTAFARGRQLTLSTLVQGAWALCLAHRSGWNDVVFGLTVSGRPPQLAGVESMVGVFINTLPLRVEIRRDEKLGDWLRGIQDLQAELRHFEYAPLVDVHGWSGVARTQPLFESILVYQNFPVEPQRAQSETSVSFAEVKSVVRTNYPISIVAGSAGGDLMLKMLYDPARFGPMTVARMLERLRTVLAGMASAEGRLSDVSLLDVQLLSAAERHQVLYEWQTPAEVASPLCVHELVAAQARRTPEAPAVVFGGAEVTYGQFDRQANRLAHRLRRLGVGPEERVGIFMERSLEMVVGLLGILKAGGAYVPLDTAYPPDRLSWIAADAGVTVLLTRARERDRLPDPEGRTVVCLDAADEDTGIAAEEAPASGVTALNLAYVMYTSGSTGRPKGVAIEHRAIHWLIATLCREELRPEDRVAQASTAAFDAATYEIWGALTRGACLVGIPPEVVVSPRELAARLAEERISVLYLTAALFSQTVSQVPAAFSALRCVMSSGEAADVGAYRRVLASGPPERLLHLYGPTETTVFSSWCRIDEVAPDCTNLSIGWPIRGTQAYLLDGELQPVPVGLSGELYIGGDGLGRGYLGRAELTAASFVPAPFAAEPGARLYRTGDRVRFLPEGRLEFLGRLDDQVKIRGVRVEPGEVQALLGRHPAIQESAVLVSGDTLVDRRLVAYVVPRPGEEPAAAELRLFLRASLPETMVPAAFVFLAALPLSANGKVDRRALPQPGFASPAPDAGEAAPRSPVERELAVVWAEVFGIENVGIRDDFFQLGGHSLLAMQLTSRVRRLFGVELGLRDFLEEPTVEAMARAVETLRRDGAGLAVPPLRRIARDRPLPLSFAQQRLWFVDRLHPESDLYNISLSFRVTGALDRRALDESLDEIVRRHEILRTVFASPNGQPVQVVREAGLGGVPLFDLGALPPGRRDEESRRQARGEAERPFDLARGPLLRVRLLRLAAEDHVVLFSMHHIASDGWSMGVLIGELKALYTAYREARPSLLPELPVQYADFAAWQREWLAGEVLEGQISYWRQQLDATAPGLQLPTDHPLPLRPSHRGGRQAFPVESDLFTSLRGLAQRENATPFMVLLAVFQALLGRYSGQDDFNVGTPIAGRHHAGLEHLIGLFVNVLVLRADLSEDPDFRDHLSRVRETALGAYAHQDLPFEQLVDALGAPRDVRRNPLFQVILELQNAPLESVALPGLHLRFVPTEGRPVRLDLELHFIVDRGLHGILVYDTELFDAATAGRLAAHLRTLLAEALAFPERRISELPLLAGPERHQVLGEWSDTSARPLAVSALELFAAHVARAPEAVAVAWEGEPLTYAQLDRRANQLAHYLVALGTGPDQLVGIAMERSPEMIVAMLAVLKAGGAYLPLDPGYPADRLAFMFDDSGIQVLLTEEAVLDQLPPFPGFTICPESSWEVAAQGEEPLRATAQPGNLAYVIYTSGSTGRPKGVMVAHRGLPNLIAAQVELLDVRPGDRVLQFASPSFDASVWEIWMALGTGATLVLGPQGELLLGDRLFDLLREEGITHLTLPPSALATLSGALPAELPALRTLCVAGEECPPELARRWSSGRRFFNAYGPSEATVCVSVAKIRDGGLRLPIGRPLRNMRAEVLDRALHPLPAGVPGELCAGGAGLARGYLGRPDLTAERFVPAPMSSIPGERLYRTGDLARRLPDGTLEFLGRIDRQVKLRGFRIELGEIEAALRSHPAVTDAVVVVRLPSEGRQTEDSMASSTAGLAAYVVCPGEAATAADLSGHLALRLPAHMVPATFAFLDAFPLTPSGKVDRRALPEPEAVRPASKTGFLAPRTVTEQGVAAIWSEVLGLEQPGVEDNFFELGGHSLLAVQVVARLADAFGVELPLQDLFERPRLGELAAWVEECRLGGAPPVTLPLVPVPRGGELPLSFAQERLWFIDQLEPGSSLYNVPVQARLAEKPRIQALRRTLGEILRRHEVLRTRYESVAGRPVQVIDREPAGEILPLVDLGGLEGAARGREVRRLAVEDAERPFDLSRGPVFRAVLVRLDERLDEAEHRLLANLHHIVCDAASTEVLLRELSALYAAFSAGEPSPLPELPVQYADYAAWQRGWFASEAAAAELAYWRGVLGADPPVLELPTDRPRPAVQTYRGATRAVALSGELGASLGRFSRQSGTTLFMTLLAVFVGLLRRYSGQSDLSVGTPISGRHRMELEGLIGFFLNTLVIRVDSPGDPRFADLLALVREKSLAAFAHQDLPFEKLVEELQPSRNLSHSPLFQVLFVLLHSSAAPSLPGGRWHGEPVEVRTSKFDLTLSIEAGESGMAVAVEYNTDLFDDTTMARLLDHLGRLAAGVALHPEQRLSVLPMLGEAERQALLVEGNDTSSSYAVGGVHRLFEAQVERMPEATALVWEGESLSYGELDRRARRLARRLMELGVGVESRVGLQLERSVDLLIGLLAILKAGGAYVPIDPLYPPQRRELMLADAQVSVLLTRESLAAELPGRYSLLCLEREPLGSALDGRWSPVEVAESNLAYVIYTSGSTGRPKGVSLPHGALRNLIEWHLETLLGGARTLQFASVSFDASFHEMFACWGSGGTLYLISEEVRRDVASLGQYLVSRGLEKVILPVVVLQQLAEEYGREGALPPLQEVTTTGEQLQTTRAMGELFERLGSCAFHNHYGPSESHVVTAYRLSREPGEWLTHPSIGVPIANSTTYLLDRDLVPVPAGVAGELYLGGVCLARGYLGRPDLTADRFVPHPFSEAGGERLYRTGDKVRRLVDGTLDFLGRFDHQVKVRGFRVELEEVESVLGRHPEVLQTVVIAREMGIGDRRLVAYLVTAGGGGSTREWRQYLKERLPEYMVPSWFVVLESLPLTPNGKVDRRALPEPERAGADAGAGYVAPRTPAEEVVAAIWSEVLGVPRVGAEDNFFELGGHSLLAVRVIARLRAIFPVDLPLRVLFERPTVEGTAAAVTEAVGGEGVANEIMHLYEQLQELSEEEVQESLSQ